MLELNLDEFVVVRGTTVAVRGVLKLAFVGDYSSRFFADDGDGSTGSSSSTLLMSSDAATLLSNGCGINFS